MGTISEKLTYLDETRENIRQSINSIGGSLTNSDTFRSYSDAIDEIYEKFPKVEGEGSNITLENTMEASIKSELEGDTSQASTPTPDSPQPINVVSGRQEVDIIGKNLFDNELSSSIKQRNCTISFVNGEIVVSATGTDCYFGEVANAGTSWSESLGQLIKVNPSTTYTFNVSNDLFTKNFMVKYNTNKVSTGTIQINTNIKTITTDSDTEYVSFRVGYGSSVSGTSYKMNIQFEKGLQATTYEEYKGQSYEINLGKNLIATPQNNTAITNSGLTYLRRNDGSVKISGTTNRVYDYIMTTTYEFKAGKTYTFSWDVTTDFLPVLYLQFNSTNGGQLNLTKTVTSVTRTIVEDQTLAFKWSQGSGKTVNLDFKVQIEKGSQATSYTPYKTPIELCEINDYKDRIYKSNGTWYLEKKIGKVVLNGSELWQGNNNSFYSTAIDSLALWNSYQNYSNYFKSYNEKMTPSTVVSEDSMSIGGSNATDGLRIRIKLVSMNISTANDFKTWLSTHNTIVYYILATPTTTEITDSELIKQLAEFGDAKSYEGTTNINVDGDLPIILNVKALEDIFSQ